VVVILFGVCIRSLLLRSSLVVMLLHITFGINRFPCRFLFWLGDFYEIGCRQRTIWWRVSHENKLCVIGCGALRLLIIYFSLVLVSIPYGVLFRRGFSSANPYHLHDHVIQFVYSQEVREFGVPLCSLFGYVAFGFVE
jgi:hypothetical protein